MPATKKAPPWSAAEDARLKDLWHVMNAREISRVMGRPYPGLCFRAKRLGLKAKRPGCESIRAIADRTGLAQKTIASLIEDRQLHKYPAMYTRHSDEGAETAWFVATLEIDEAVERYLDSETLVEGARRVGCCRNTLIKALLAIGIKRPGRIAKLRWWRVLRADIDRAIIVWDTRETLPRIAYRYRLAYAVVRRAFVNVGIKTPRGARWSAEEVDRIMAAAGVCAKVA